MKVIMIVYAMCFGAFACVSAQPSKTESYLEGFGKGIETSNPYNPVEWAPFFAWWYSPEVATVLHGAKNVADLVVDDQARHTIGRDYGNKGLDGMYVTGYTAGNIVRILMYMAPAMVRNMINVASYVASPYDHGAVEGAYPLEKMRLMAMWGMGATLLPVLIHALQSAVIQQLSK